MKIMWDSPPWIIIIPVVVFICLLIIVGIIAYLVLKKCYRWNVFPISVSKEMLNEDNLTLPGTSLSNMSSLQGSMHTLYKIETTLDLSMNTISTSLATANDSSSHSPRPNTSTILRNTVPKPKEFFTKGDEKESNFDRFSKVMSDQTEQTVSTSFVATTTSTPTSSDPKQDPSKTLFLRNPIKERLSMKKFTKVLNELSELHGRSNESLTNNEKPKEMEEVIDFILDRSVMGWSLPTDLDPETAKELDESISPEITQRTDEVLQRKINEAYKIVQKMDFSLPDDATEEEKEKNRLAFHKMVWIVANDNRKPTDL